MKKIVLVLNVLLFGSSFVKATKDQALDRMALSIHTKKSVIDPLALDEIKTLKEARKLFEPYLRLHSNPFFVKDYESQAFKTETANKYHAFLKTLKEAPNLDKIIENLQTVQKELQVAFDTAPAEQWTEKALNNCERILLIELSSKEDKDNYDKENIERSLKYHGLKGSDDKEAFVAEINKFFATYDQNEAMKEIKEILSFQELSKPYIKKPVEAVAQDQQIVNLAENTEQQIVSNLEEENAKKLQLQEEKEAKKQAMLQKIQEKKEQQAKELEEMQKQLEALNQE